MSNGQQCCALELPCCKPPGSPAGALARMIYSGLLPENGSPMNSITTLGDCTRAASAILAEYDLVPKGVGKAIGDAYWSVFENAVRHGHTIEP